MGTIGSVVLKMSADHQQLTEGLGHGAKSVHSFGQSLNNVHSEHFAEGMHHGGEAAKSFGESLEHLKHIAEGLIAAFAIEKIGEWVKSSIEGATAAYRLSGALGITTGSLQELHAAGKLAGISNEDFDASLKKMVKNLGEAKEGTGPAAEALQRLHIAGKQLEGLHTDEVFKLIAEKISKVKDPLEQAKDEIGLFSKEGQNLQVIFANGAEGIEEAGEKARKFGTALSEVDAAKLVGANEKFEEIGLAIQGVENQLAIALAPMLSMIGEKVLSIIPAADKMRSAFMSGIEGIATGIGYLIDAWRMVQVGVLAMATGASAAIEAVILVVSKLADAVVWVADKLGMHIDKPKFIDDSLESLHQMTSSFGKQTVDMFNQPSAVANVHKFFDGIKTKADETAKKMVETKAKLTQPLTDGFNDAGKKVDAALAEMKEKIDTFGMTEGQKDLFKLSKMANPEQLKLAQQYMNKLDQLEKHKKEVEDATALTKKVLDANPLTKYQDELGKLDNLHHKGLISAQVYAAGVAEANKGLVDSFKKLNEAANRKVAAQERRFDFHGPTAKVDVDPMRQLQKTSEQQAKDVALSREYLAQMYQIQMNQVNTDITVDLPN